MCALRLQPAVKPNQQDEEVLASVRSIVELMQDQGLMQNIDARSSAQLTQVIRQVLPLIPELAPGLGYTGGFPLTDYWENDPLCGQCCMQCTTC